MNADDPEFLVELRTVIPASVSAKAEAEARSAEAAAIELLASAGHVTRLWRSTDERGAFTYGLWRARDGATLTSILERLPLAPWMDVVVRPLTRHDNDPGHPLVRDERV